MHNVVGVRFRNAGKVYYFDPADIILKISDNVIVETSRGLEMGRVIMESKAMDKKDLVLPLKNVLRKATHADFYQVEENSNKEQEAFEICTKKISEHKLKMKLIKVEYTFDRSKIIFYFTAEGRIDFRELVKDLASVFHTRIELRQIGVRDQAKLIGGMGSCGRPFCCSTFLEDFESVSIRMAKSQNLSLNPTKISGVCGRLMCCLRFEADTYDDDREDYPDTGKIVVTPAGEARVLWINVVKRQVRVEILESKTQRDFPIEEIDAED